MYHTANAQAVQQAMLTLLDQVTASTTLTYTLNPIGQGTAGTYTLRQGGSPVFYGAYTLVGGKLLVTTQNTTAFMPVDFNSPVALRQLGHGVRLAYAHR